MTFKYLLLYCTLFIVHCASSIPTASCQSILNPSFEIWGVPGSCEVNTTADGWTNYSNSGIGSDEANFTICPTTIPPAASDGDTYSRSVAFGFSGEGQFQLVSGFIIGNSYTISFDYSGSNLYAGSDPVQWHLFIDDIDVNQTPVFNSTDAFWTNHIYSFTATDTLHKIGVRSYATFSSAAGSAAIDNFGLSISLPIALFTAPNDICPGTCTSFNNGSINAATFQWYFPGANPASSTDVQPSSICYLTPGIYDVTLIAGNVNGSDTLTLTNYINVFPYSPPQSIIQNGDTLFSSTGFISYQWFYAGDTIPGATDSWYVALQSGDYSVVCLDSNGCSVEAVLLNVVASLHPDSYWDTADNQQPVVLYPNPVIDQLVVGSSGSDSYRDIIKPVEIRVYNFCGQEMQVVRLRPDSYRDSNYELPTLDVSHLSPGMYWLVLTSSQKTFRAKFVKQ